MSLVTDILSSAGELEKADLAGQIRTLNGQISQIKTKVLESLQKRYVEFLQLTIFTSELDNQISFYVSEIENLNNLINNELIGQIQESAEEFQLLGKQLVVMATALQGIQKIIEAHEALEKCNHAFQQGDFVQSVEWLQKVGQLLSVLCPIWEDHVEVLRGLKREYVINQEKIKYDMREAWKVYLKWEIEESLEGAPSSTSHIKYHPKSVQLTVRKVNDGEPVPLESLTIAMHRVGYLDAVLASFAKALQQHIFCPVITHHLDIDVVDSNQSASLKLKDGDNVRTSKNPSPVTVFQKLLTVFEFLYEAFGKIVIEEDAAASETLMHKIGQMVYKDFCEVLVRDCLSPAVPSHKKGLKQYGEIVDATTKFHERLVAIEFLKADDESILHYAQNVDTLFAAKLCQELLEKARKLMLQELYDSVQVEESESGTSKRERKCTAQEQLGGIKGEPGLPAEITETGDCSDSSLRNVNLLVFPKCQISKSTDKLVNLLYEIMEDATSNTECASRLYVTARNIVDLYCDIVPCFHKSDLEMFPQQSALLHNNCMYITHHLMTMGHTFGSHLPPPLNGDLVTFVDLVPKVRKVGVSTFLSQMGSQRKQLLDTLKQAGDFQSMIGDGKVVTAVRKAIKQCLLKLQQLGNVWRVVLPVNVYCKALGTLVNTLVDDVVLRVLALEDLPADDAVHLIGIFGIITEMVPGFFKMDNNQPDAPVQVQRYVPKWLKFQELAFVLDATMQDILDRWSSGKGPLALDFTVDEVKHLIRALFQNTDHRAAVLAKIK